MDFVQFFSFQRLNLAFATFFLFAQHQQHQIIHELQENLEQVTRDKMALEAKIMEMSSYKNEIMILQNEIVKLQVRASVETKLPLKHLSFWAIASLSSLGFFHVYLFTFVF